MDKINSARDAVDYYENIFYLKKRMETNNDPDFMVELHEYLIK